MKIAHISDLHLGYSSGKKKDPITRINMREQDGYNAFHECITQIIENSVDLVVCTGDFFHTPSPSIYTLVKGQEELRRLVDANIPFYNLAGNHDATDSVKDIPANRILHSPELNLYSYIEPYKVVEVGENVVLHLISHHGYTQQKETMENIKPITNKFNILCTHGSCYDPEENLILHTDSSPREIVIPESVLQLPWNYILLGHIHERGWLGSKDKLTDTTGRKIFYGGSLLRRGFSDKECKLGRGWTLWNIKNNTMTPTFFNVTQREQSEHLFFCDKKEISQIEEEMIYCFKNKINLDNNPIVRFILIDLTNQLKMQLNWKLLSEFINQCLTFSTKLKTKDQIKKELSGEHFNFDLLEAYSAYWDLVKNDYDEVFQKPIKEISNNLLKKGQDSILSE